jgi:hypothetical protein
MGFHVKLVSAEGYGIVGKFELLADELPQVEDEIRVAVHTTTWDSPIDHTVRARVVDLKPKQKLPIVATQVRE